MAEHPIHGLMRAALQSLKELVEVNTVIGDPVELPDGDVIIPVSRVSLGFAAGGSEFGNPDGGGGRSRMEEYGLDEGFGGGGGGGGSGGNFPFGGGSGAGISVQPVGFLVVARDGVRMLSVDGSRGMEKLLDMAPRLLERLAGGRGKKLRQQQGQQPGQQRGQPSRSQDQESGDAADPLDLIFGNQPRRKGRTLQLGGQRGGQAAGQTGRQRQEGGAGGSRGRRGAGEGQQAAGRRGGEGNRGGEGRYGTQSRQPAMGLGSGMQDGTLDGYAEPQKERAARVVRTLTELLESSARRGRGRY